MHSQVQEFINGFKQVYPSEIEHVFYRGYCYWFANILAQRFHGEIWFNPMMVHFGCRIAGTLYDIYGEITPTREFPSGEYPEEDFRYWENWDEYQLRNYEIAQSVIDGCIKKVR